MLEIGRHIQYCIDKNRIAFYESKEMFSDALCWAEKFEEYVNTLPEDYYETVGDYYTEIFLFTENKLKEKFGNV
jgi:hypothetical protein